MISFINLNDYSIFSKPMKQEMQTFAKKLHFHWNDDSNFILINLLDTYLNAPL
jgi:hypothetical protein